MTVLILLVGILGIVTARAAVIEECSVEDGVFVDKVYHEKEVLKDGLDRPYQLAVDYSTNTLYFSYNLKSDEEDVFVSAYLNLNTKEFGNIEGVSNGFAQTVDELNHEIYIGGDSGIYKYDHKTKKAEYYAARDSNVWGLYFNEVLFYISYPSQFLYTIANGAASRFKDLEDTKVEQFAIDKDGDVFFTNDTGLYSQKTGSQFHSQNATFYKDKFSVRALTTDINGKPYLCASDGIYSIDKTVQSVDKMAAIDDAFGLTFDNENNIIYSDSVQIVRLKKTSKRCQEKMAGDDKDKGDESKKEDV